jgi:hypothetical protein
MSSFAPAPHPTGIFGSTRAQCRSEHGPQRICVPPLNEDVVHAILEFFRSPDLDDRLGPLLDVGFPAKHLVENSFLAGLCLISKAWLEPSRQLLYRIARVHRSPSNNLFARTIRNSPRLGLFVRLLIVSEAACELAVLGCLDLMPNIDTVWVSSTTPHSHDEVLSLSGVTRLVYGPGSYASSWVGDGRWARARAAWPHLDTLILDSRYHLAWMSKISFPYLRTLAWIHGTIYPESLEKIGPHTLRTIKMHKVYKFRQALQLIIEQQHQSLEWLEVTDSGHVFDHGELDAEHYALATKLKYLHFRENVVFIDPYSELPPNLVHLVFDINNLTPMDALDLLETWKGRPLKFVDLLLLNSVDPEGDYQWGIVRDRARSMGIEFRVKSQRSEAWEAWAEAPGFDALGA